MGLLHHVLVPVASEEDARETASALEPYLTDINRMTAVHVIEKGGGSIDKAPVEKRRTDAESLLAAFESAIGESADVDTRIEFGTDVGDTIVETALEAGATAIAFRPRGGSGIVRMLTGNTAEDLVMEPALPVIALPTPDEE